MIRSILFAGFTLLQGGAGPAPIVFNSSDELLKKQFYKAVEQGDLQTINYLLENGVPADFELSNDGSSALELAAQFNKFDVASILLALGADVNKTDKYGNTALMSAALKAGPQMLNLLIDNGADINHLGRPNKITFRSTPLSIAFQNPNDLTNAELLIKKGANIYSDYVSSPIRLETDLTDEEARRIRENLPKNSLLNSAFIGAVGKIDRKSLDEQLTKIQKIVPPNHTVLYQSPLLRGNDDILYAFYLPEDKNIQTALETEISLVMVSDKKTTNLKARFDLKIGNQGAHIFSYHVEKVGLWSLPQNRAGSQAHALLRPIIKIVQAGPGLLLIEAAKKDDPEEVRAILKSVYETASSNPNLSMQENRANGEKAVESIINLQDAEGKTALFYAVLNNDIALVEMLLNQNADPTIPDNTGKGPLDYVIELETECNRIKTIQALLSAYKNRVIKQNEKSEATFQPSKIVPNAQGLLLIQAAKNDDVDAVRKILNSVYESASNNPNLSENENKANAEEAVKSTINIQDDEGKAPLHYAVLNYDYLLAGILLNKKADPTLPDNTGKSPLDYVLEFETECKKIKTIQALLFAYKNRAFRNQAEAVEEQNKVNSVSSN